MGNRLSKIYTRTGDQGTTALADGRRLSKADLRMECIGTLDELNSALGIVLSQEVPERVREALAPVQHRLFDMGAELSLPGYQSVDTAQVEALEALLDDLNGDLPPLKEFILPGGSPAASHCHLARAICRRAERLVVALNASDGPVSEPLLSYMNRLSDLLFVAARCIARQGGGEEVFWLHERQRPDGAP
ncbi:ATP:cob(I)alamin adenosyltransferase [Alkalispirillum mobile]|uniref:Corrinoid adenosyltransferase n=1 Tax=Alkalispirillum mobile TaxID=85925 RepID=A0A498C6H3_9GAMM|nr:cob(I)yrinic acid a,c-diamide adenosyltransferase [Alkalispirillum mobile]RLK51322.1 ATP:cob(I)alamin adenosyltransferase [Alkalispirillum mobile]